MERLRASEKNEETFSEAERLAKSMLTGLSHISTQIAEFTQGEITKETLLKDVRKFVQSADEAIIQLWSLSGIESPNPSDISVYRK